MVNYGDINIKSDTHITIGLESKDESTFELDNISVGCGCTTAREEKRNGEYRVKASLDLNKVNGKFRKGITIQYKLQKALKRTRVILTGHLTK